MERWEVQGQVLKSLTDIPKMTGLEILKLEEVGDAFMRSLECDKARKLAAIANANFYFTL